MKWVMLALSLIINNVNAQTVKTTGYGANYNEALQSAKTSAAEQATSTFVTGKRELNNGVLSENLAQYNGALIDSVDVKSVEVKDGLYEVQIIATVSTNKVNSFEISGQSESPDAALVGKMIEIVQDRQKVIDTFVNISNVTYPFVVTSFENTKYSAVNSNVEISHYMRVQWNTKWVDDVLNFVKAINQPINEDTKAVICVNNTCYSVPALPTIDKIVGYNIAQRYNDGDITTVGKSMFYVNDNHGRGSVKLWEYRNDTHVIWRTFSVGLTPVVPTLQIWLGKSDDHYVVTKMTPTDLKRIVGFTYAIDRETKYR